MHSPYLEFRSTGLLARAGGPIGIQDLESFQLIQPQPQLAVPSLLQPLFELKSEALEISIMRFSALEGSDRQFERPRTADVLSILVPPGARFSSVRGRVDDRVRANLKHPFISANPTQMFHRDLPQNIRGVIGKRRHQALVQTALEELPGVCEGLVREQVEPIFAVGPQLPLIILVCQNRQRFRSDLQLLYVLVFPAPRVRMLWLPAVLIRLLERHARVRNSQRAHIARFLDMRRARVPVPDVVP